MPKTVLGLLIFNQMKPSDSQKLGQAALSLLEKQRAKHPNHHPLTIRYAEILMQGGYYARCEAVLSQYVRQRPKDDYGWYLLAEVHGLAGNILGVHQARAEYFILNGVFDKAQQQLQNALKLSKNNHHAKALLEEHLNDVKKMRQQQAKL